MLKIVLDTNVLVSALLKPGSTPELILLLILNHRVDLYLSKDIFKEYQEVLNREKFKKYLNQKKIQKFLKKIKNNASMAVPKESVEVIKEDPSDNKFLECALECKANFLITGNIKHFPSKKFRETRIVTPADFVRIVVDTI
ncbi:MAG: putative toxin-antitoxin system toxin component, PIN family [Desulfobacteraceae bacterium]|nr:putative toxin-antitoxin system toxin component, PIN family [Desulfobacteraceae bacterium]MBC2755917.1 putative toxin-antitoxin system toxin component, PIN family [Desulfobacteraceae bacterium]